MEFVRWSSEFSPLTVRLSLMTNTTFSVFLSICLIPAVFKNTLRFLFYCIYQLTWYWLCFIIRNMGLLLSLKSLNISGNSTLRTHRVCLLVCIFGRMNGRKETVVSQLTTKIPSQIYRITNRTHLVTLRCAKGHSL